MTTNSPADWTNVPSDSDSRDCVDVIVRCRGDTTVHPSPAALVEANRRRKERLAKWLEMNRDHKSNDSPGKKNPEAGT